MSLESALADVRHRISEAARQSGRTADAITLVAVCKKQPLDKVLAAFDLGVTDFGENLAQELATKAEALAKAGRRPRWHFIGRLQRNKVNVLLRHAEVVQSLDRLELAQALSARATVDLDVLVQVNVGDEVQKGGVPARQAIDLARAIARLPRLRVRGLMAIPPQAADPTPYFRALQSLSMALRQTPEGVLATGLSMGMSDDFETAIRCGATLVRVGTAIFGERVTQEKDQVNT